MKTCDHSSELIIICDYYYYFSITLRIKTVKFSIELTLNIITVFILHFSTWLVGHLS